jgi:hypothetical protein
MDIKVEYFYECGSNGIVSYNIISTTENSSKTIMPKKNLNPVLT